MTLLGAALRELDQGGFVLLQHYDRCSTRSSPLEKHNIRVVQVNWRYECLMLCATERLKLSHLGGWQRGAWCCYLLVTVEDSREGELLLHTVINVVGKAAAIMRRDYSATLPPRVRGEFFASCVRAHAGTMLMAMGAFLFSHCVDWYGKDVLELTSFLYISGAMSGIREFVAFDPT